MLPPEPSLHIFASNKKMLLKPSPPWSSRLLRSAVTAGFKRAYRHVQVEPDKFMDHLRDVEGLPLRNWADVFLLGPEVLNPVAENLIKGAAKAAALEGAGLGFGGFLTLVPDMGILTAITTRLLQKLSLLYGFPYASEEEVVELWIAASSAAGLDLGKEFLEKRAVQKIVPRIIDKIAAKVGAEVAEKWAGKLIPVVSAGVGGALNYYFVRSWGRRARRHFEERHNATAQKMSQTTITVSPTILPELGR